MNNEYKSNIPDSKKLLTANNNEKNPIVIKKTICAVSNDDFVLDLTPIIQLCSNKGSNSFISIDSIEGTISESSPVRFELDGIRFCGSGCTGALAFISPDQKNFTAIFSSFIAQSQGNTSNKSCSRNYCKICIMLDPNGLKKNEKFTINITISGVAVLDQESCANVLEDCKRILTLKGAYANNYVANFNIEGKLAYCECHCS